MCKTQQKSETYWCDRVDSECDRPHASWSSFDALLGRRDAPVTGEIDPSTLHEIFDRKVEAIRDATSQAASPSFLPIHAGFVLSQLGLVTVDNVVAANHKLPDKQSAVFH